MIRIQHHANSAYGAFFDDIDVTDIRGGGRAWSYLWGCAYRHVILRGWIAGLTFKWQSHFSPQDHRVEKRYQKANQKLYEAVDWAIDVSEAKFTTLQTLSGIPPHLVRRDPTTQFVLTRTSAEAIVREKPHSIWSIVAEELIKSPMPGEVVIVGRGAERHEADLTLAHELVAAGLLK